MQDHELAAVGCLLGTAVGDALGLPYEGLSRRRGVRLWGEPDRYRLLPGGRGLVSDDTEHTCMVAQALIESAGDPDRFQKNLARRFRWWLLGIPAGIGSATLRACLKLWIGFPPSRSGVFSAGNGPAMRSALIGAVVDDPEAISELVSRSTRITHTDPRAEFGALAVALAARHARSTMPDPIEYENELRSRLAGRAGGADEFLDRISAAIASAGRAESARAFADTMGLSRGVTGFVNHTVPVALQIVWRHNRDFDRAVREAVGCGGDTDTLAAIVGGIVGAGVGRDGIPQAWRTALVEWPRTVGWMERLGQQLGRVRNQGRPERPPGVPPLMVPARNALFLAVVLAHVGRRALPPY